MKRILLLGTLFSLVLLSCVNKREKALELLNDGINKIYYGDFKGAVTSLEGALEYDATMAEAWFHLSNARFNMGNAEASMKDMDRAIELSPGYADAFFNRGNLWFYFGDKEKACSDWKKAEELGKANVRDKTRHCP